MDKMEESQHHAGFMILREKGINRKSQHMLVVILMKKSDNRVEKLACYQSGHPFPQENKWKYTNIQRHTAFFVSVWVHNLCTGVLHNDCCLVFAWVNGFSFTVIWIKSAKAFDSAFNSDINVMVVYTLSKVRWNMWVIVKQDGEVIARAWQDKLLTFTGLLYLSFTVNVSGVACSHCFITSGNAQMNKNWEKQIDR